MMMCLKKFGLLSALACGVATSAFCANERQTTLAPEEVDQPGGGTLRLNVLTTGNVAGLLTLVDPRNSSIPYAVVKAYLDGICKIRLSEDAGEGETIENAVLSDLRALVDSFQELVGNNETFRELDGDQKVSFSKCIDAFRCIVSRYSAEKDPAWLEKMSLSSFYKVRTGWIMTQQPQNLLEEKLIPFLRGDSIQLLYFYGNNPIEVSGLSTVKNYNDLCGKVTGIVECLCKYNCNYQDKNFFMTDLDAFVDRLQNLNIEKWRDFESRMPTLKQRNFNTLNIDEKLDLVAYVLVLELNALKEEKRQTERRNYRPLIAGVPRVTGDPVLDAVFYFGAAKH